MEISFDNKTIMTYSEFSHQIKRSQELMESVVPDVNEDIGRIVSTQTAVYLKSKDLTGRGLNVTGELSAVLLYITEEENAVSFLTLSKPFYLDYELEGLEEERLAQIRLSVTNTEARILNPRKVSVTVELSGELSAYREEELAVSSVGGSGDCRGLHMKTDTVEAVLNNMVSEKTFAFNEQYSFPQEKGEPSRLVSQAVDFNVGEVQSVGGRLIVKGTVCVDVSYMTEDGGCPRRHRFSSPFSQIVDGGGDCCESSSASIALTSAYFDLVDTIGGERSLDVELHAALQVVSRCRQQIEYVADAYCNRMPAMCCVENRSVNQDTQLRRLRLETDSSVAIADDCQEVLCVFSSVSQASAGEDKSSANLVLELIYRGKDGKLNSARRSLVLEGEGGSGRVLGSRISEESYTPQGDKLQCRLLVELLLQSSRSMELPVVETVKLDEEAAYAMGELPSITLVRAGDESLWELAKRYHSSVESILAVNEPGGEGKRLLLIPKES